MIRSNEKGERSLEVTDPDFGGAGVEIEGAFFGDLCGRVGWRKDLDTDFRRAREDKGLVVQFGPVLAQPSDINSLDAISGRNSAFRQSLAFRHERMQKRDDVVLTTGMTKARRWSHKDMSMPISLDSIRKLGEVAIGEDLSPTTKIELGL